METVLDSLKELQEQLREKNLKYNEMKQRFETSNEVCVLRPPMRCVF